MKTLGLIGLLLFCCSGRAGELGTYTVRVGWADIPGLDSLKFIVRAHVGKKRRSKSHLVTRTRKTSHKFSFVAERGKTIHVWIKFCHGSGDSRDCSEWAHISGWLNFEGAPVPGPAANSFILTQAQCGAT